MPREVREPSVTDRIAVTDPVFGELDRFGAVARYPKAQVLCVVGISKLSSFIDTIAFSVACKI